MEIKMISEETYEEFSNVFLDSYDKIIAGTLDENEQILRASGFSETDIVKIKNGWVPDGWPVPNGSIYPANH